MIAVTSYQTSIVAALISLMIVLSGPLVEQLLLFSWQEARDLVWVVCSIIEVSKG